MEQRTYSAIFFRQRSDAPLQVAFVAPSSEIDAWARVPTKKTGNIRNFQRAEIPQHAKEVSQFFSDSHNSSPTAVVVGFDAIRGHGHVRLLQSDGATPFDSASVVPGEPGVGAFQVSWAQEEDPEESAELIAAIAARRALVTDFVFAELRDVTNIERPTLEELLRFVTQMVHRGEGSTIEPPPGDEAEDTDEGYTDLSSELPPELKNRMPGLSPSERQIALGRLLFLAQLQDQNLRVKSMETLRELYEEVVDECKPGLLIDGQHRVQGTKKLGRIPFLVTAIPKAAWPELAFQFIVTNRTARRVPESLLISIVGNSLSREQRATIEERLRQAGIRVGLIEAVMRVHEDESSPFYGMLAFGVEDEHGFLDAAAMRGKVIQLWFERKKPVQQLFDHFCQGRRRVDRTEYWKDEELWFEYFIAFWSAVKTRYEGSAVFSSELIDVAKKEPASKLMTATVLKIFQEAVLMHLERYVRNKASTEGVAPAASLPDAQRFSDLVRNTLAPLTPDFFTEWTLTGFDGSKGAREDLEDAIVKVISKDNTVAQIKRGHRLFRAPSQS